LYVCGFHVRHSARISKTQDVPGLGKVNFFKKQCGTVCVSLP
jgi:hypothetical protein